ncbi:MAG TPA: DEAD/DEAH box helicase, partial [Polyangiaceae bacterium LLY-WYZ-15_(1-7)]|nr:DEAD/DEAH box helicase [Polyangiaceae bacterium LLY-WYZ-15_(1-7)]
STARRDGDHARDGAPQSGAQTIGVTGAARHPASGGRATAAATLVPCLRVFSDTVFVARDAHGNDLEEVEAPLLRLSFEYPRLRQRVRCDDPQERFFAASAEGVRAYPRDFDAEHRARRVLESFGAVPVECLDTVGVPPDVEADYLVRIGGDVHAYCAFTAYALPQLEKLGWEVQVDPGFAYQVVRERAEWYAEVEPDEERPDWFALELGVEVGGERVSLLPALLDMLDEGAEGDSLWALTRGVKDCFALPVSDTHHVAVERDQLRALIRVVIELYEGVGDEVRFPAQRAAALESLDEAFAATNTELQWKDEENAREKGFSLSAAPKDRDEPAGLKATLRPYQREGLAWLQHLRAEGVGGVLADDMGLGKTLQTISHLATEKAEGRMDLPSVVIAPTSLMGNWKREIEKFAPHLRVVEYHGSKRHARWADVPTADIVLTSYPILLRDEETITSRPWHFVVLDEAHAIKNRKSRLFRAAKTIEARHRLCLTGTPVENHLGELWSLFEFLNPGFLGSEERFRHWYRTPIERFGDEERLMALREQVSPYILRRVKNDVATELPPKTRLLKPVDLRGKQRELYEAIRLAAHTKVRNTIRRKGMAGSTVPILDALMKLRQLCCDPRLVRMDAARFVRESAKYEALMELVETQLADGHRILVFSQFTSMLRLIGAGLKEKGIGHLTLTGASKNRQQLCDRFEAGEVDVFLISLKAGGTGLNLVSADTVIHYDPWWNPQAQEQATDRAYRIGQTKPVFVYDLFVAGSVEERMLGLQQKKRKLADAILAGEVPQTASPLTEDDVEVLFSPLPR